MAVQCASFPTGIVVITPNALDQLTPADTQRGLQRHQVGDWGDADLTLRQIVEVCDNGLSCGMRRRGRNFAETGASRCWANGWWKSWAKP